MTLFNTQASITCDITKDLMRFFLNFSDQDAVMQIELHFAALLPIAGAHCFCLQLQCKAYYL
jgi:hypothetical protein